MAKVSVIVPVYNVASYLKRCIDSLLMQTFRDFELILVNDGSRDEGGEICDAYARMDSRVVVLHQRNGGLSAARNRGIDWALAYSKSEYLVFIDSDDWVMENYLEELCKGCRLSGSCAAVMSQRVFEHEYPQLLNGEVAWQIKTSHEYWKNGSLPMTAWGKMYPKYLFEKMRYPIGKIHEDEYVTHRVLFENETIAISEAPLYCYFQRNDSIMGQGFSKRSLDVIPALEEQYNFFVKRGFDDLADRTLNGLMYKLGNAIILLSETRFRAELKQMLYRQGKPVVPFAYYRAAMPIGAFFVYPYGKRLRELFSRRGVVGAMKQICQRVLTLFKR